MTAIIIKKKPAKGRKFALVGESGGGKGTYMKELFAKYNKKPRKILSSANDYSANDEVYYDFVSLIEACMGNESKTIPGYFPDEVRDTVIVIDEAQIYIPRKLEDLQRKHPKFMRMLANCRKFNNVIIFMTHQFQYLPAWLPGYINGIVRFNTGENLRTQATRFNQFPALIKNFTDKPELKLHEKVYIHLR